MEVTIEDWIAPSISNEINKYWGNWKGEKSWEFKVGVEFYECEISKRILIGSDISYRVQKK